MCDDGNDLMNRKCALKIAQKTKMIMAMIIVYHRAKKGFKYMPK